ncbi:hypothetical protein EJ896_20225 [Klebsiella quasipneumoniae subsp. similipneumoniae]|nr:hypothetical protein EJ896_20225 [Klebsiella quasipneumoniae subsp. similipneumoniae]
MKGSCRPGKAQPPPGNTTGTVPDYCPAALRLRGPTGCEPVRGSCRPGKAQPPSGDTTGTVPDISPGGAALAGRSGMQPFDINRLAAVAHNTQQHQEQVDEIQIQR